MRISLIGMAGAGKSYWSTRLEKVGYRRFCCDDLIAEKLGDELKKPDGTSMGVDEWMGWPYESRYGECEAKYLAYEIEVLTELMDLLENSSQDAVKHIVIDTTGSVIYTGERLIQRLRKTTTVVHLSTPPERMDHLFEIYLSEPHPVLWRGWYNKKPHEDNKAALARCYPELLASRKGLYETNAHMTIDHELRTRPDFDENSLINTIQRMNTQGEG